MQAIARVNRIFKDKPGGLVVDYLGIASDLKKHCPSILIQAEKATPQRHRKKLLQRLLKNGSGEPAFL